MIHNMYYIMNYCQKVVLFENIGDNTAELLDIYLYSP
jgi:hypothetical protein